MSLSLSSLQNSVTFGKKFPKGAKLNKIRHNFAYLSEMERVSKTLHAPQYAENLGLLQRTIATKNRGPVAVQQVLNAFTNQHPHTLRQIAQNAKLSPWQAFKALHILKKAPFIKSGGMPFLYQLNRYGFQARTNY